MDDGASSVHFGSQAGNDSILVTKPDKYAIDYKEGKEIKKDAPPVPSIKQRARAKKIYVDEGFYPDGMEVNYDVLGATAKSFLVKNRVVR